MIDEALRQVPGGWILSDASLAVPPQSTWFEAAHWQDQIVGQGQGRGTAWFMDTQWGAWVLRHYRRGGFAARLSSDAYLFHGLKATRPFREWGVMRDAHAAGLPVPRPVAAYVQRSGLTYRGDILMQRVPLATSLADSLATGDMPETRWHALAQSVASLHKAGYWHADLNARNLLWSATDHRWWIIDFDRAQRRVPGVWGEQNVQRLLRSLNKLQAAGELTYSAARWEGFLHAYRQLR